MYLDLRSVRSILISRIADLDLPFEAGKMPFSSESWGMPEADGLYDPGQERDACGVGFIVHIDGRTSHRILVDAQELSRR